MKTLGDIICQNPLEVIDELAKERESGSFLCINCPNPTWNQETPSRRLGHKPKNPDLFCDAECEGEFDSKLMYVEGRYYYPGEED